MNEMLQTPSKPSVSQKTKELTISSIVKLYSDLKDQGYSEIEKLCQIFFAEAGVDISKQQQNTQQSNVDKFGLKKADNKVMEIISTTFPSLTPQQMKNQSYRFGIQDNSVTASKPQFGALRGFFNAMSGSSSADSQDYEDVVDPRILDAPICDIRIIQRGDQIPEGFYRISRTPSGKKANLNTNSGGNSLYLCIKKDLVGDSTPITSLVVFFPDSNEFVPPGYFPVCRNRHACNLNGGTSACRIFLAFKRDKHSFPLTDLQVVFPSKNETVPKDFMLLDRSPTGISGDLNTGTGGVKLFLAYRQRISRLFEFVFASSERSSRGLGEKDNQKVGTGDFDTIMSPATSSSLQCGSHSPVSPTSPEPQGRNRSLSVQSESLLGLEVEGLESVDDEDYEETISSSDAPIGNYPTSSSVSSSATLTSEECRSPALNRDFFSRSAVCALLSVLLMRSSQDFTLKAIQSLIQLLKDTDFFETELKGDFPLGWSFITFTKKGWVPASLLDVVVDVICDRLEACLEWETEELLHFLSLMIKHSAGRISPSSHPRVLRTIMFLCSYVSTRPAWLVSDAYLPRPSSSSNGEGSNNDSFVNNNGSSNTANEFPAAKLLREIILAVLVQIELHGGIADSLPSSVESGDASPLRRRRSLPSDVILASSPTSASFLTPSNEENHDKDDKDSNDQEEMDELFFICEDLLKEITKHHAGPSWSMVFWSSMTGFGLQLFGEDRAYLQAFLTLMAVVKSAWLPVRQDGSGNGCNGGPGVTAAGAPGVALSANGTRPASVGGNNPASTGSTVFGAALHPRDLGLKLLSLQAVIDFCQGTGEKGRHSKVLGYIIRRVIVCCTLTNAAGKPALHPGLMTMPSNSQINTNKPIPTSNSNSNANGSSTASSTLSNNGNNTASTSTPNNPSSTANTGSALPTYFCFRSHRVFSQLLQVISSLWRYWRGHIRMEFAVLVDQMIIGVLQASPFRIPPIYQLLVLQEVGSWFEQPYLLLEMFVNYDLDERFVSHWNIFSYLVRAVCAIARRTSIKISTSAWNWRPTQSASGNSSNPNGSGWDTYAILAADPGLPFVSPREVNIHALEQVSKIARTVMDATGHAHLITRDWKMRSRSLGAGGGWTEDEADSENADNLSHTKEDSNTSNTIATNTANIANIANTTNTNSSSLAAASVRSRRAAHEEAEELIQEAVRLYKAKKSLKKAIDYLVSKKFIASNPQEVASFLRIYQYLFDPSALGDFLSEGGVTPREVEYWSQIRYRYIRAISFVEMEVEPALRLFLTGCGIRLPGEAQKIDRFVETFTKAYWQDNHATQYCSFQTMDTVHILVYSIIMLNTDLHRANDRKKTKRMTREEFINNLRGVDGGNNLPRDMLIRIYDSIAAEPISLAVSDAEAEMDSGSNGVNTPSSSANGASSEGGSGNMPSNTGSNNASTPSQRRTSLASFFTSSLSSAISSNNESKIVTGPTNGGGSSNTFSLNNSLGSGFFLRDVIRNLREGEDLLRSMGHKHFRFQLMGVDTNISLDLVCFMFETVWFHFHAITESLLWSEVSSESDMQVLFSALDILCYSLTSSIFLDLQVEKMTFSAELLKFREQMEPPSVSSGREITDDSWFTEVESTTPESTMETIAKVHKLFSRMKDSIFQVTHHELTLSVASKIEKKARVLDNNTFFVREGDLAKQNHTGKYVTYRFFLFSDTLLYAHQSMSGEYKVHRQLNLTSLHVFDTEHPTTFYIDHPSKSFYLMAESSDAKYTWIRDLEQTADACRKRDVDRTGRKMSIIGRIEDQQQHQLQHQQSASSASSVRSGIASTVSMTSATGAGAGISADSMEATLDSSSIMNQSQTEGSSDSRTDMNLSNTNSNNNHGSNSSNESSSISPVSSPTPVDREAQRKQKIAQLQQVVETLKGKELDVLFQGVSSCCFCLL